MSVSVLILTLNEEINLAACLESVSWCNDIVVLDSLSDDGTLSIARSRGVRVVQRAFDGYASQRNYGLREIEYRNEWLLMVDADERVPGDLRDEIREVVSSPAQGIALYYMRRRDHLFGRWIRRSSGYPTWFGRLAKVGQVWVEREINEEYRTNGGSGRLLAHLDHYPFNKGFSEWIQKHDRYSTAEAALKFERRAKMPAPDKSIAPGALRRRKYLKDLLYALPARPLIVFLGLYVARGGFLEGRAGLTFSLLRAWYEFMIDCKWRELIRRARGLAV